MYDEGYDGLGTPDFCPYEFPDSAARQTEIEIDHDADDTPAMTAFLRRGGECVWINGYRRPRLVVETYPMMPCPTEPGAWYAGLVREIPYGKGTPLSERFADSVLRLEGEGWIHVNPHVRTGEDAW